MEGERTPDHSSETRNESTEEKIQQLERELKEILEEELRDLDPYNSVKLASYKEFEIWTLQNDVNPKDYKKKSIPKVELTCVSINEGDVVLPSYTLKQPYPMVFKVGKDEEWVTIWSKKNLSEKA